MDFERLKAERGWPRATVGLNPSFSRFLEAARKAKQGWERRDLLEKIRVEQGHPRGQELPAPAVPCHFLPGVS